MNFYNLVDSNKRKSTIIIVCFALFVAITLYIMLRAFGYGPDVLIFAVLGSSLGSIISYYASDKIVLSISGAREANRKEFFDFYTVTENLAMSQQMPMPKLYIIEDTAMNAFATGRDPEHAVVCATTGLLSRLNRTEIEGVIAHELSHVKNYDIRLMTIVSVMVGMIALIADLMIRLSYWGGGRRKRDNDNSGQLQVIFMIAGFLLALLSPIIAQLIQLAISRRREFLADASGAAMTKYPEGLAKALEKISQDREPLEAANKATAHLYFADPLKNLHSGVGWFAGLFNTHPPVQERITALRG